MSLHVTISIKGDQEVMNKVKKLGDTMLHLKPAFDVIGKQARNYYATIGITDRGRPWGQEWRGYSKAYQEWKQRHYHGRPMMIVTGRLERSFDWQADENSVRIFNTAPYFKYHQSSAERHRLPRRQMMGINAPIKRIVGEAISDEITRKIRNA